VGLPALINIPHEPCGNQYRTEDGKRVCNSDVAAYGPIEVAGILQLPCHNLENLVTHIPDLNKNFCVIQSVSSLCQPCFKFVKWSGTRNASRQSFV